MNKSNETAWHMMAHQLRIVENAPSGEPRLGATCPCCHKYHRLSRDYPGIEWTTYQSYYCCGAEHAFSVRYDPAGDLNVRRIE